MNSTQQTLPAGTIAIFEAGGFAGESGLDRLKPAERRFITYGSLTSTSSSASLHGTSSGGTPAPDLRARGRSDRLEEHYLRTSDDTYALEDRRQGPRHGGPRDEAPHQRVGHGLRRGRLRPRHPAHPLLVFKLAGAKHAERKVHAVEGLVRSLAFTELTSSNLEAMAVSSLPPADRAAADAAVAHFKDAEAHDAATVKVDADMKELTHDIDRLREHMKAAGEHTAGQGNPFAARVLAAEDRLHGLRDKRESEERAARAARAAARAKLLKLAAS